MPELNQQVIADLLKISRTTVSRCFTNHKGINPTTRAEVFSMAAKLGYQYLQPRSPRKNSQKQLTIGILICSEVEEYYRSDYESPGVEVIRGVSEFAQLNNWHPEIYFVSPQATSLSDPLLAKIKPLKKRAWAGVLLIYPFNAKIIGELTTRFPCVSLIQQYGVSVDSIDVNHYNGITLMMNRLRAQRPKIGFFSRKYPVEAAWSFRRLSAFVENLARAGMRYEEKDVIHLDTSSPETLNEGYKKIVERIKDGVTGWICAADHQAYDLIAALKERGYHVPKDVSVTGFDGIQRPPGAPPLDTVKIPYYEIGFSGARRLSEKIKKRFDTVHEILLECRVQEGETIALPARKKRS